MRRDAVRRIALSLPEAEERETWETATFRVRNKIFVMFSEQERHLWIKSTHDEQAALVAMDGDTFFVPPYVGPSGWVGIWLDGAVDWAELADLLRDSYRLVAPKKLAALLEESGE
jgi:predicted DNA-binding protein (MmcQ/YjbR family)